MENDNKRKNQEAIMPPPSKKMHLPEPKSLLITKEKKEIEEEVPQEEYEQDDESDEEEELDKEEILREIIEVTLVFKKNIQIYYKSEQIDEDAFNKDHLLKLAQQFEKHIIQNQELRLKYAKTPEKFMESEVDLDEDVNFF